MEEGDGDWIETNEVVDAALKDAQFARYIRLLNALYACISEALHVWK
jgi:hypothetical protein